MIRLAEWMFGGWSGKAAALAALVLAVAGWWQLDRFKQRQVGRQEAIAKVERNNADLRARADAAGNRSTNGAGGLLNPNYRD